ncbi:MAG: hypothetical protein H7331_11730 [Bacteroidia bacterium]|nr:hypothetical protein [Bacteroidia bacterium]
MFPPIKRTEIAVELNELIIVETTLTNPVYAFKKLIIFVNKWIKKYKKFNANKNERNSAYFYLFKLPE